ncbi:MAG: hypothetical protein ABOK23_05390 [Candidatus Methanoperedens sp.]|nr:hypothetical protein [Candidatus Methanoperedens sp.]MCZ7394982.1 hypothetical protein [Candidatus Methanoperedens sp.]
MFNVFNIERSESEIRDLKRFWNELSYKDRDNSIGHASIFIGDYPSSLPLSLIPKLGDIPGDIKTRRDKVMEEIEKLKILNSKSKWKYMLKLVPEPYKPNLLGCIFKYLSLSKNDETKLIDYLGITDFDEYNDIYDFCSNLFSQRTSAMSSAFRNYLGKQ